MGESTLQEAERIINGERRESYGGALESFDRIAQLWTPVLCVTVTAEQVALCMIQLKVARYMNGQQRDSIVDIAGYAGCLEKIANERTPDAEDAPIVSIVSDKSHDDVTNTAAPDTGKAASVGKKPGDRIVETMSEGYVNWSGVASRLENRDIDEFCTFKKTTSAAQTVSTIMRKYQLLKAVATPRENEPDKSLISVTRYSDQ